MIDKDEPSITLAIYDFAADGKRLRALYDRSIEVMTDAGVAPLELAWHIAGKKHGKWKTFARMREKLDAEDFSQVVSISIGHLEPGPEFNYRRRVADFAISSENKHRGWELDWTLYPHKIGLTEETAVDNMLTLAAATGGRYAFIYHMSHRWLPNFYPGGLQSGDEIVKKEHPDFDANRGWWGRLSWESGVPLLLRDVFPINLLTRPYLHLPVGNSTLERWVIEDESRGTLVPLEGNATITVWRVPPRSIPRVREELFKAGIVFYWRFFESGDPLKRDFAKPFTPPDPIPDIYRADHHTGRDPKFTR